MKHGTSLFRPRTVTGDGEGLVSRGGLAWLAEAAELTGLGGGLADAFSTLRWRSHHPGRTMARWCCRSLMGRRVCRIWRCCATSRPWPAPVASEATVWRTFEQVGPAELRGLAAARAAARARAWAAGAGPDGEVLTIDLDATIVTTKADKQDAAATYKRTYGHHPLLAMAGDSGEVLAGMLRPGNAGPNTAADHVVLLREAIAGLPPEWQAGHRPGDDPDDAAKELVVRADAGGTSHWLVEECRDRNIGFSLGSPSPLRSVTPSRSPAMTPGCLRSTATASPEGTRVIVRRERPPAPVPSCRCLIRPGSCVCSLGWFCPQVAISRSSRPRQGPPLRASMAGLRCSSVL